jgi:hypothetical protein
MTLPGNVVCLVQDYLPVEYFIVPETDPGIQQVMAQRPFFNIIDAHGKTIAVQK